VKFGVSFFWIFVISGCVYGPKLKNKASYLGGESYTSATAVGVVPLSLKTRKKDSAISGEVQSKGLTGLPLRDVDVILRDKNKRILQKVRTNQKGEYSFLENLENGDYELEFKYKNKSQKRMVPLKGYKAKVLRVYFD